MLGWAHLLLAALAVQRLTELGVAERNTARLRARGAREAGARHYPLFILLHGTWLVAQTLLTAANPPVNWTLLALAALLQGARFWVIRSLGRFWTTRIITIDRTPLVASGPYRLFAHPNYMIVAIEIPLYPLILGLPELALVFGVMNLALLTYRIRIENQALASRQQ